MTRGRDCSRCKMRAYKRGLCFHHWNETQGKVFDGESKRYVKVNKVKVKKERKRGPGNQH